MSGESYDGQTHNGKYNGAGTLTREDGTVWEGTWRNGKPHGQFRVMVPGKYTYTGNMSLGKRNGPGRIAMSDGRVIEGVWKMGRRISAKDSTPGSHPVQFRRVITAAGVVCEGEWSGGKMQGKCTMTLAGRYRFVGMVRDDLPDGEGVLTYDYGMSMKGVWRAGVFLRGVIAEPGGSVYHGSVQNGLRHGSGSLVRGHQQLTLQGSWHAGALYGSVVEHRVDKYLYNGQYAKGFRHGAGTLTVSPCGTTVQGTWSRGVLSGAVEVSVLSGAVEVSVLRAGTPVVIQGRIDDNKDWQGPEFDFYATFPTEWVHTKNSTFFEDTLECINRFVRQGMTTQEMAEKIGVSELDLLDWYATGMRVALPPTSHHEMTVKLRRWLGAEMAARDGVSTTEKTIKETTDSRVNEDKINKKETSGHATCTDIGKEKPENATCAGVKRARDVDGGTMSATKEPRHVE